MSRDSFIHYGDPIGAALYAAHLEAEVTHWRYSEYAKELRKEKLEKYVQLEEEYCEQLSKAHEKLGAAILYDFQLKLSKQVLEEEARAYADVFGDLPDTWYAIRQGRYKKPLAKQTKSRAKRVK